MWYSGHKPDFIIAKSNLIHVLDIISDFFPKNGTYPIIFLVE